MVPHLKTALSGPLFGVEPQILATRPTIERWFRNQWQREAQFYFLLEEAA
jgi:glutamate--cysteine ligase